uniref:C3H1-type domain-containing protein n=1 Tax=Ditylenchus dipsaci TaxID=166011 RepID=A0A915CPW1_9BILA
MTNSKLYKTELCRSWVDTGRCNYGERCQYAHGETEKRPIPRHPKYKTEACQSYHKTGYCPYGPRCHFIHNEEPSVLAGLVANEANSSSTASGGTTPTNGSNPNLLLHRQLTSLSSVSSASSPTTPQHMPLNMRMPPPPAQISAAYFQQQHQPLSSTHSWCVAGDIQQQNNANNFLAARASNPSVDWSMYCPQNGIQQFYAGLQQQHQQQPANAMRIPISSTFSYLFINNR